MVEWQGFTKLKWERVTPTEWRAGRFRILKWFATDCGNRLPRYAVRMDVEDLGSHESLDKAKRVAQGRHELGQAQKNRVAIETDIRRRFGKRLGLERGALLDLYGLR